MFHRQHCEICIQSDYAEPCQTFFLLSHFESNNWSWRSRGWIILRLCVLCLVFLFFSLSLSLLPFPFFLPLSFFCLKKQLRNTSYFYPLPVFVFLLVQNQFAMISPSSRRLSHIIRLPLSLSPYIAIVSVIGERKIRYEQIGVFLQRTHL